MRVLRLLDAANRGGTEIQALDICNNAERAGLDYTVVLAGGGTLEDRYRASGVKVIRLQRRSPFDLYLTSQIRGIIRERSIQVVHGHQAVEGLHLYAASRGLKAKRVLNFDGSVYDRKNRLMLKFLIPRMDANVVVSAGLQRMLADDDGLDTSDFRVIHTSSDPARLRSAGRPIREQLGIANDTLLLGMVGSFYRGHRKDQLTICKALPAVFAKFPRAHFIFSGGVERGAEEKLEACRAICEENGFTHRVHFLGLDSSVPDILAGLDLFVFSSFHEGLPLALCESMLAGVPMIASDIEPLLEATDDGKYAVMFRTGDSTDLAEKMIDMLGDRDRRQRLASEALAYAGENFSIDAHLRELKLLYSSLVDG